MRRSYRFSIAGLMGAVLVTAIGLAAMRDSSEETWGGVMLLFTFAVLALAVVGVVCRAGAERAWWLGFALFGCGYLALAFWYGDDNHTHRLPTMAWLDMLSTKLGLTPPGPLRFGGMGGSGARDGGLLNVGILAFQGCVGRAPLFHEYRPYAQIGHSLWTLLFAFVGGALARFLFAIPARRSESAAPEVLVTGPPSWKRLVRPAGVAVAGLTLGAMLFTARCRATPGLWVGGTFLVTWGLLGLAALGAILDRSRRGDIWLGAALFGIGYLILAFSRDREPGYPPRIPTDHFLLALRTWLPPSAEGFFDTSGGVASANARILETLNQPVPMHFATETSLGDILKSIVQATKGPDGKVLPIYVDPIGLSEAEKTLESTVSLDLEGVPLKTTLCLCLNQLDLKYVVRGGVLMITYLPRDDELLPLYEDPFLISGHCLLALFAAALGGALAPLVSGRRGEPSDQSPAAIPLTPVSNGPN